MRSISIALFLAPALLLLASCAGERNVVVLLPDSDGKTGSIVVSNQAGSRILSEQKQATMISSPSTPPTPPAPMADEALRTNFGEAFARADKALYRAKSASKSCFSMYGE